MSDNAMKIADEMSAQMATIATLKAALIVAMEGLEPFAATATHDIGNDEEDSDMFHPMDTRYSQAPFICVGDLRRARSAIAQIDVALAKEGKC